MHMKQQTTANKYRCSGLYGLALSRITECGKVKGEIISFPKIFEKLCRGFSIQKQEVWEILRIFRDLGQIEIVPYHGVRIL